MTNQPSQDKPSEAKLIRSLQSAKDYFDKADFSHAEKVFLEIHSQFPDDHNCLFGLGLIAKQEEKFTEAEQYFKQTLAISPNHAPCLVNLGELAYQQQKLPQAKQYFQQALEIEPEYPEGLICLGKLYKEEGDWDEAEKHYLKALSINPNLADNLICLANLYYDLGNWEQALYFYNKALALDPSNDLYIFNLSLLQLTLGNWKEGFKNYEHREKTADYISNVTTLDKTRPEKISGKKILLLTEQGYGDTIHFVRYAKLLKNSGAKVSFVCPETLKPLFAKCSWIDVTESNPKKLSQSFDYQALVGSLPYFFATNIDNVPADTPYLFADKGKIHQFAKLMSSQEQLKIGVSWEGRPSHLKHQQRKIPFGLLQPLIEQPNIAFFSLGTEPPPNTSRVLDMSIHTKDFSDTAAIIENLDLVITVDTATAHLAGAMDKPCWVLISKVPDWRWLLDRTDSPWYKSIKLYRQQESRDWTIVIQNVINDLQGFTNLLQSLKSANSLFEQHDFSQSKKIFQTVLNKHPSNYNALYGLGLIYLHENHFEKAETHFLKAIKKFPNFSDCLFKLGTTYKSMGQYEKAEIYLKKALDIDPNNTQCLMDLGNTYQTTEQWKKAKSCYLKVLSLKEKYPACLMNLGNLYQKTGLWDKAEKNYKKALTIRPNYPKCLLNLGVLQLLLGNYEEGFKNFENREPCLEHKKIKPFPIPYLSEQENLTNKHILVVSEQGFGDNFQFVRYTKCLKDTGATVSLLCRQQISSLMDSCPWIDNIEDNFNNFSEVFDYQILIGSLPQYFHTTVDTIPADVPYLFSNPAKTAHFNKLLQCSQQLKVGLSWQGNTENPADKIRSIPLSTLESLFELKDIKFFSVGVEAPSTEAENLITNMSGHIKDFSDTAAIIENIDLVITVDTATAHLAGAMNKPCWVLINKVPDWRWMLDRTDSPWYPSIKLYRQKEHANWMDVIKRVTQDLENYRR